MHMIKIISNKYILHTASCRVEFLETLKVTLAYDRQRQQYMSVLHAFRWALHKSDQIYDHPVYIYLLYLTIT